MSERFVIVDTREVEEAPKIAEALRNNGVVVEERLLEAGDYITGNKIIERKSSLDLIHSIANRRLWEQLEKLKSAEGYTPVLLVENPLTLIQKFTKWNLRSVCGLVASIELDWGVPILWAPNRTWTVAYLLSLSRPREERAHPLRLVPKGEESLESIRASVLCGIPGVSTVRARALVSHFRTLRRLAEASVREIAEVEGVGPKTATKIWEVFNLDERLLDEI
jgi:Fanconi anemia group M protein